MNADRIVGSVAALFLLAAVSMGQASSTTPTDGRLVFESEGCFSCHAINGTGGTVGPDLGRQFPVRNGDDLAAKMWNHSPKMMLLMARTKTERPVFTGHSFRSLADFLSYIRFLGRPGDAAAGKRLFSEKHCASCHTIDHAAAGKHPLDSLGVFVAPVRLAQAMWNHYGDMRTAGGKNAVDLPRFQDDEFADLSAYIRSASSRRPAREVRSTMGDPVLGDTLFHRKGCFGCHVARAVGPRLDTVGTAKSLTQIAGVLWNHAGAMASVAGTANQPFPRLEGDEMANILSFLYVRGTPATAGSAQLGEALFRDKGCADCHAEGNTVQAPVLSKFESFPDETDFLAALWNHAVRMEQLRLSRGKGLPSLKPEEVRSLYLFVSARAVPSH